MIESIFSAEFPSRSALRLLIIAFFTHTAFAQTELLSDLKTAVMMGGVFPRGDLGKVLEIRPLVGVRISSTYHRGWKAHGEIQYSLLGGPATLRTVHYCKTGAGLAYAFATRIYPAAGCGLSNYFIRSASGKSVDLMLLDDNESEFGFYPFIYWDAPVLTRVSARIEMQWNIIFSGPSYIHLPKACIGLAWTWW